MFNQKLEIMLPQSIDYDRLIANALYSQVNEGVSINLEMHSPDTGFMVAHPFSESLTFENVTSVEVTQIMKFIRDNDSILAYPNNYVSIWKDAETRKVHVDISTQYFSKSTALNVAITQRQKAIWDVEENQEIRINRNSIPYENVLTTCANCGGTFRRIDMARENGQDYCEECIRNIV